jgi:Icc-related predicted phosphoesterase
MVLRLVIISDTHGTHSQQDFPALPDGDVLIHAGDWTTNGSKQQIEDFLIWLKRQPHKHKVFIAGNHDRAFEQSLPFKNMMLTRHCLLHGMHYLEDSEVVIEGVKFYGSPWQPEFHPEYWVFNMPRGGEALRRKWQQIPDDTNVLITHSPLKGVLDRCVNQHPVYPQEAGCELLIERVREIKPALHVCGHIHEAYGMNPYKVAPTTSLNASTCDLSYRPVNEPVIFDL